MAILGIIGYAIFGYLIYSGASLDRLWPKAAILIVGSAAALAVFGTLNFYVDPMRMGRDPLAALPLNFAIKIPICAFWFFVGRGAGWLKARFGG